jgi:hypothetical protein
VILVGEVRDRNARIAVQSALTGHLVMSSLHATGELGALSPARHGTSCSSWRRRSSAWWPSAVRKICDAHDLLAHQPGAAVVPPLVEASTFHFVRWHRLYLPGTGLPRLARRYEVLR